jgi:hypothetical protein
MEHGCDRRAIRAAIAPEILLVLWLYATIDGVGKEILTIESANAKVIQALGIEPGPLIRQEAVLRNIGG